MLQFFENINCKSRSDIHKESCESKLSLQEVQKAIKCLKNNKSPGSDGLSSEFYKTFVNELSPCILKTLLESIVKWCVATYSYSGYYYTSSETK